MASRLTVKPEMVVIADMIGDRDQQIYKEQNSTLNWWLEFGTLRLAWVTVMYFFQLPSGRCRMITRRSSRRASRRLT